ncbi:MAG: PP2C family protein-serine/threonine phosphatase [Bacteroidia bacterium]
MRFLSKIWLVLLFLVFVKHSISQTKIRNTDGYYNFSYIYKNADIDRPSYESNAKWLFNKSDDAKFILNKIDESNWTPVKGNILKEDSFPIRFNGYGWFRLHIYIDTVISEDWSILFHHQGASNIFINEKFVGSYGNVSKDPNKEVRYLPLGEPIPLPPLKKGEWLHIAVRYSNTGYERSYNSSGILEAGLKFEIEPTREYIKDMRNSQYINNFIGVFSFSFFLTLSFIHFLLFIFYRAKKTNLYFTYLSLILSYYFSLIFTRSHTHQPDISSILVLIAVIALPTFMYLLVIVLKSIFGFQRNIVSRILGIITVISWIAALIHQVFFFFCFVVVTLSSLIYALYLLYKALKERKRGSRLIGAGYGFFALFIIGLIAYSILFGGIQAENNFVAYLVLVLMILCVASIPITMSIFLAWEFATTNKTLQLKLVEVESLSRRNIEQEKEKQKILSQQNAILEIQVNERTKEIFEQKKLIEEKNKDITDSINYAQKIQQSILPTDEEIKGLFEDSFVFFRPRDIVSGDFYQFKKKDNCKYAIMADCTGHGVPGALMSMVGSNLLHQIIIERGVEMPNDILKELHSEVKFALRQNAENDSRDGMDISISMFKEGKLYVASANRPVFIINNQELQEIKPTKKSIGGSQSENDIEFDLNIVSCQKGSMVYMFSDGYPDQFGGPKGKKYKVKALIETLTKISTKDCKDQNHELSKIFVDWKNELEQIDDVCLIGIRCT